jgi:acetyltransferase-like isoleucine patch superfamily enzyme
VRLGVDPNVLDDGGLGRICFFEMTTSGLEEMAIEERDRQTSTRDHFYRLVSFDFQPRPPRREMSLIAPNAEVDPRSSVGDSTRVWGLAKVRENAVVGDNCIIGRGAYIDAGVVVGDNCKIQNDALVYAPARLEDGVFIGPAAVLTNDSFPRAINPDGSLKAASDWEMVGVTVRRGASVGARSVVLGGVDVGEWSLIAAGSVVTKDVPRHALVVGVPARRIGWVGMTGVPLSRHGEVWIEDETGTQFRETEEGLTPE